MNNSIQEQFNEIANATIQAFQDVENSVDEDLNESYALYRSLRFYDAHRRLLFRL